MWRKYKISVDKFINNSKDDFFKINIIPFSVDEETSEKIESIPDNPVLSELFKVYCNKYVISGKKSLVIEPKKDFYTVYELMMLITFIEKHKMYEYTEDKIKINYALFWKDKTFLETGCLIIDNDYPVIYNFYMSSVVDDILGHLYDFKPRKDG